MTYSPEDICYEKTNSKTEENEILPVVRLMRSVRATSLNQLNSAHATMSSRVSYERSAASNFAKN